MRSYSVKLYSPLDLLRLLRTERGDRVRLDVGATATINVKDKSFEIDGPPIEEESLEEMLRALASSRQMRTFRESGAVDVIVTFEGARFLVRAIRAFGQFRLELLVIQV